MDDDDFLDEPLSKFEAETLALSAGMTCDMMRVDGCMDMENAERLIPNAREQYRRYSRAALLAHREYRGMVQPPVELQEFIKDRMAQADGHADFNSAIKNNPDLQDLYQRYSFAAVFTIHRHAKNISPLTEN